MVGARRRCRVQTERVSGVRQSQEHIPTPHDLPNLLPPLGCMLGATQHPTSGIAAPSLHPQSEWRPTNAGTTFSATTLQLRLVSSCIESTTSTTSMSMRYDCQPRWDILGRLPFRFREKPPSIRWWQSSVHAARSSLVLEPSRQEDRPVSNFTQARVSALMVSLPGLLEKCDVFVFGGDASMCASNVTDRTHRLHWDRSTSQTFSAKRKAFQPHRYM